MNVQRPNEPALAALAAHTARPFAEARAMPPEVYTSERFLEMELERIFRREWFCIGRAETLAEPGDYVTHEIAGQPVAVIRGRDGELRAMSNVCLHRMSTLLEGRGNRKAIVCPYHAWTYNLDGTLRGAPAMTKNEGFCKADYRLPQLRCEEWLGWVYVTLNPDAVPVAERLAPLAGLIERFDMASYRECFREVHLWDTNWKVLAENYMESYHLPVCHVGTVGAYTGLGAVECVPGDETFNIHWFPKEGLPIGEAHPANTRLAGSERTTSALVSIYPGHMLTLTPGYFWYLSLHPRGVGKVEMILGGGFAKEFLEDGDIDAHTAALKTLLDEVNIEDRHCTEAVYRGARSPLAAPGHVSHLERPCYDFSHYIARMVMGDD